MAIRRCCARLLLAACFFAFLIAQFSFAADQWLPITKEDLELKQVPQNPGVQAVILYRSNEHNEPQGYEEHYYRIKILTQEGLKYANVETIAVVENYSYIDEIKARTIKPDGTVVPFQGKIFQKTIAKKKSFNLYAKTFTIPDVQVGSIIEYRYRERFDTWVGMGSGTEWKIEDELFTLRGHFVFRQGPLLPIRWVFNRLPTDAKPERQKDNSIVLDLENIPAFEKEPYMPPESEVRARVYFFYEPLDTPKTVDEYWKKQGNEWRKEVEKFIDRRGALQKEVAAVLKPEDNTPELKMRRLYARVQQLRNRTFDREQTEKEQQKEDLKSNTNVEDVLKRGYGYQDSLNRLYLGLLRAAGIEATMINVSEREDSFLHKNIPQWSEQLDREVVIARADGKEYFLDPGTVYCPFGQLPWEDSNADGWRMDAMSWGRTPDLRSADSVESRKALLELDRDGTLTGSMTVSFTGADALSRRLQSREDDDQQKKKDLEDEVKDWFPSGSKVELVKSDGWKDSSVPLTFDFKVTINGVASSTGKRMLMPVSIFQGRHPFQISKRVHGIYFHFPFSQKDDVSIAVPAGLQLETVTKPNEITSNWCAYSLTASQEGNILHIQRTFQMDGLLFGAADYPKLQYFYNKVKAGDDEQAVLRSQTSVAN